MSTSTNMFRQAEVDTLRHTYGRAKALARMVARKPDSSSNLQCAVALSDLSLPIPKPLTSRFMSLGVDERSAALIASTLARVITSYRNSCEADYRRRRAALQGGPGTPATLPALYIAVYTQAVNDWSRYLLEDIIPRVIQAGKRRKAGETKSSGVQQARRPFNQNAVPLLERFFASNAFPSRLEKYELALTCSMDYRQIHVWFQNRRSRCRKESRTLEKREASNGPRQILEQTVIDTLLPRESWEEDHQNTVDGGTTCLGGCKQLNRLLSPVAPPHAFPSPYPPVCSYDPFPAAEGRRSFHTPWMRTNRTSNPPRPSTSISDLASWLAKLSISDNGHEATQQPYTIADSLRVCETSQRVLGFVTPCAPAPHPALIQRDRGRPRRHHSAAHRMPTKDHPNISLRPVQLPDITWAAMRSDLQPDTTSCPTSSSALSRPPQQNAKRILPRRAPKHPPRSHILDKDPLSSGGPPAKRRPRHSFASTSSIGSACSSDTDSPLATPPTPPIALPLTPETYFSQGIGAAKSPEMSQTASLTPISLHLCEPLCGAVDLNSAFSSSHDFD
ncbi:hypothetical protein BD414DRAFT_300860 [Trametes punicea]|nr:hypothetical protein BD414DRAFT_300860 [Trametes punicea]